MLQAVMHHYQVIAIARILFPGNVPYLVLVYFYTTVIGNCFIDKGVYTLQEPEALFTQFEQQLSRTAAHIQYPGPAVYIEVGNPRGQTRFTQKKQH